jgi:hypothetical protein
MLFIQSAGSCISYFICKLCIDWLTSDGTFWLTFWLTLYFSGGRYAPGVVVYLCASIPHTWWPTIDDYSHFGDCGKWLEKLIKEEIKRHIHNLALCVIVVRMLTLFFLLLDIPFQCISIDRYLG